MMDNQNNNIILKLNNITKKFSGVVALKNVSLSFYTGAVHALVGSNGAGKSTLMRLVNGAIRPDSGQIIFKNKPIQINSPRLANSMGIVMINQELMLIPELSVAENILLGRLPVNKFGVVNWKEANSLARKLVNSLGADIEPTKIVKNLSVSEMQVVEISRALSKQADIFIMDEPTAALPESEVNKLVELINKLKERGKTVIYVSHKMREIFQIADNITILRDGEIVGNFEVKDINVTKVLNLMMDKKKENGVIKKKNYEIGSILLSVKHLKRRGIFQDINFDLYSHEIIGLAGLVGSRRTEILHSIFGLAPFDSGEIILNGKKISRITPEKMINYRIGFIPEDRRKQGLVTGMSVKDNLMLVSQRFISKVGILKLFQEIKICNSIRKELDIKAPSLRVEVSTLSGGNQQKVVIGKWFATKSKIFIFDEPTRGIDVGSKNEIFNIMKRFANEGAGIIFVSTEIEELLIVSDRIITLKSGRKTGEFLKKEVTLDIIMKFI